MAVEIYQEIELSLTESLIPIVLHVKQFDHNCRKIRCVIYQDATEYAIPDGVIISCTGTRPDGLLFQYSSESSPDYIFIVDGKIVFTITDFMTEKFGRYPIDLLILSGDGDVIGMVYAHIKSGARICPEPAHGCGDLCECSRCLGRRDGERGYR